MISRETLTKFNQNKEKTDLQCNLMFENIIQTEEIEEVE